MVLRRIGLFALCCALFATEPNDATRRWWSHVVALSGDELQGRDTGSEGYRKASAYVVKQFHAAGLQPAGENQSWYQNVPLRSVRFRPDLSDAALVRPDGGSLPLKWLEQISIPARASAPD